jgi:hypothetical protein
MIRRTRIQTMAQTERRRTGRIAVGDHLTAELVEVAQKITIVNIGTGGFALATDEWLPSLARPEVRFASTDRRWTSPVFEARMSFALLQPRKSGPHKGRYITGFAFRDARNPKVARQIQELIDHVSQVAA